jgi:hypothetical protein
MWSVRRLSITTTTTFMALAGAVFLTTAAGLACPSSLSQPG